MKRNFCVLVLMLASAIIILPAESRAAVTGDKTNSASEYNYEPQIRVQIGRNRRNRRWQRRANRQWRRAQMRNRRARVVTRTYWRNGRRYTRVVRVY
ncbi:MAG TPA: hypothetical protein VGB00_19945 [Pyrinomonadaceae bacterium]